MPTYTVTHFFDPLGSKPVALSNSQKKKKAMEFAKILERPASNTANGSVSRTGKSNLASTPRRGRGRRAGRFQDMAEDPIQKAMNRAIAEDTIQIQEPAAEQISSSDMENWVGKQPKIDFPETSREVVLDSILSSFASRNEFQKTYESEKEVTEEPLTEEIKAGIIEITHSFNSSKPPQRGRSVHRIPIEAPGRAPSPSGRRLAQARGASANRLNRAPMAHRVGEVLGEEDDLVGPFDAREDEEVLVFDGAILASSFQNESCTSRARSNSVPRRRRSTSVRSNQRSLASSVSSKNSFESERVSKPSSRDKSPGRKQDSSKKSRKSKYASDDSNSGEECKSSKNRKSRKQNSSEIDSSHPKPMAGEPQKIGRGRLPNQRSVSKARRRFLEDAPHEPDQLPSTKTIVHKPVVRKPNSDRVKARAESTGDDEAFRRVTEKVSALPRDLDLTKYDSEDSFDESTATGSVGYNEARDTDDESDSYSGRDARTANTSAESSTEYSSDASYASSVTGPAPQDDQSVDWRQDITDFYGEKVKVVNDIPEVKEINARAELIAVQAKMAVDELSKNAESLVENMNNVTLKDVELAVERAYINLFEWVKGGKSETTIEENDAEQSKMAPKIKVSSRSRLPRRRQVKSNNLDPVAEE